MHISTKTNKQIPEEWNLKEKGLYFSVQETHGLGIAPI